MLSVLGLIAEAMEFIESIPGISEILGLIDDAVEVVFQPITDGLADKLGISVPDFPTVSLVIKA